jgi:hypothetical protein
LLILLFAVLALRTALEGTCAAAIVDRRLCLLCATKNKTLDAVKTTENTKEVKTVVITKVLFYCEFSLSFLRT